MNTTIPPPAPSGAAMAPAGPNVTARQARAGSAPARKRTPPALTATASGRRRALARRGQPETPQPPPAGRSRHAGVRIRALHHQHRREQPAKRAVPPQQAIPPRRPVPAADPYLKARIHPSRTAGNLPEDRLNPTIPLPAPPGAATARAGPELTARQARPGRACRKRTPGGPSARRPGSTTCSAPPAATSTRCGSSSSGAGIAKIVVADDVAAFMSSTGLSLEVAHCSGAPGSSCAQKLPASRYAATDQAIAWRRRGQ